MGALPARAPGPRGPRLAAKLEARRRTVALWHWTQRIVLLQAQLDTSITIDGERACASASPRPEFVPRNEDQEESSPRGPRDGRHDQDPRRFDTSAVKVPPLPKVVRGVPGVAPRRVAEGPRRSGRGG